SCRIQVIGQGLVAVRILEDLLCALVDDAVQRTIQSAQNRQVTSRRVPVDTRQSPAGCECTDCAVSKLWCLRDGGDVEYLPPVGIAIPAIKVSVGRISVRRTGSVTCAGIARVADTTGPRVVCAHRHSACRPPLHGSQQSVITRRATWLAIREETDRLP